jgi:excisionase family DNA binding protein
MKESTFKSYDELPLFINAQTVAQVLGISQAGAYELLHQEDFPVLKIGSRMVVPKENFLSWIESQTGGNTL